MIYRLNIAFEGRHFADLEFRGADLAEARRRAQLVFEALPPAAGYSHELICWRNEGRAVNLFAEEPTT